MTQPGCGRRAAAKASSALSVKAQRSRMGGGGDCNLLQSQEGMKSGRERLPRSNVLSVAAAPAAVVRNPLRSQRSALSADSGDIISSLSGKYFPLKPTLLPLPPVASFFWWQRVDCHRRLTYRDSLLRFDHTGSPREQQIAE